MICAQCGGWMEQPVVEERVPKAAVALCPHCGHVNSIERFPLWFISGSSGSGKTTLTPLLRRQLPDYVVFEAEAIDYWRFRDTNGNYAPLYDQWLKVAREIAANHRPVLLLGMATPEHLAASPWRRYFSNIHCLGLVCDEAVQAARLRARPAWRNAASPEFMQAACAFTQHLAALGQHDQPEIALVDTSTASSEKTVRQIVAWVRRR